MAFFLQSYPLIMPNWAQIIGVFAMIVIFAHFMMLGVGLSRITGANFPIEISIAMGWGISVLILSFWGIFLTAPLYYPALALLGMSAAISCAGKYRPSWHELVPLGKLALIMLPFLLLMASWRPSHWDSFLNLLPNAEYLWDFDQFPRSDDAITPSVFPALPYNTQLIGYLAGFWRSDYPLAAMTLANILWQALFGLTLARILISARQFLTQNPSPPISFAAIAGGMIIATALSPGFRLELTLGDYGEPSTMVLAAWLMVMLCQMLQNVASPEPRDKSNDANILAIGLVASAFINIRQSNAALFLSIWGGMAVSGLCYLPDFARKRNFIFRLALAAILPFSLWLGWRIFVKTHFHIGELGTRPFSQWEFSRIPDILQGMGHVIAGRPFMFLIYLALIICAVMFVRRYRASLLPQLSQNQTAKYVTPDDTHRLLGAMAAAIIFWQIMLMVLYLAVIDKLGIFGADEKGAKSFYRYNSHLILAAEICVILLWQKWQEYRGQTKPKKWRVLSFLSKNTRLKFWAGFGLVVAFLVLPFFALRQVRYDLQMPRPILWTLAEQIKPLLQTGDRIAIMIPNRQRPDASFDTLRGLLSETSPRHARLTFNLIDLDPVAWAKWHSPTGFYYNHILILCIGENDLETMRAMGVKVPGLIPGLIPDLMPGQSLWLTPEPNGQFQVQNFTAIPTELVTGAHTPLWQKYPWAKAFDKNSYCIKN